MVTRLPMTDPPEVEQALWARFGHYETGFDVGANCGQSVERMLGLCGQVVSLEPNRDSFASLSAQWGLNPRVTCINAAVSDHDGIAELAQLPGKQADTGQLVTPGLSGMEWDPGDWSAVETVPCLALTLDHLAADHGQPGLVKVDTEGHETLVLLGATDVLTLRESDWLIEFHSQVNHARCAEILESHGYRTETIRHPHYIVGGHMWRQHGWIKALRG